MIELKESIELLPLVLILTSVSALINPINSELARGLMLQPAINLSANNTDTDSIEISASGVNVYVVWSEAIARSDGTLDNREIFFKASRDNGASFSNHINLSKNDGNSIHPQIAAYRNNVLVVWQDDSHGNKEIFFSRSTDTGSSFNSPINISKNYGDSELPRIVASGNSVYIVWRDSTLGNYEIFLARSTDNGANFSDIVNLSKSRGDSHLNFSSVPIAAQGNNVFVIWYDITPRNYEIFFARSIDGGTTFSDPLNISNNSGTSVHPEIAVSGSIVYAVWLDDNNGTGENYAVFFARSTSNGASFSDPVEIKNDNASNRSVGIAPKLAESGNNVYVVWHEAVTDYHFVDRDIFLARSTDNGASFGNAINLSNNAGNSANPEILASGNNVYVVWQDNAPSINRSDDPEQPMNFDVFLRESNNDGDSFDRIINLSNNEGASAAPQIAVSGTNVYVVWGDNTPGNSETVFRAGKM